MSLAALMFVDDADLCVFNSGVDAMRELVIKAQRLLDTWHNILTITGGNFRIISGIISGKRVNARWSTLHPISYM